MISAGSAANGLVSIALTKIDDGLLSIAGILLNGRVRNAVHKPDSTKFCFTCSTVKFANCSMLYFAKVIWLSPSNLITTDCKTRLAPRLIAVTVPDAGAVKTTPG